MHRRLVSMQNMLNFITWRWSVRTVSGTRGTASSSLWARYRFINLFNFWKQRRSNVLFRGWVQNGKTNRYGCFCLAPSNLFGYFLKKFLLVYPFKEDISEYLEKWQTQKQKVGSFQTGCLLGSLEQCWTCNWNRLM